MSEKNSNLSIDVEKYVEKYSSTDPSIGKLSPTRNSVSKFENEYPINEKTMKEDYINKLEDSLKLKDEKTLIKEYELETDSDFEIEKKDTFLKKFKIFVLKNPLESVLIVLIIMLSFVTLVSYSLNNFFNEENGLTINIDSIYQTYVKAQPDDDKQTSITAAINGNTENGETKQLGSIIYDDDTQAYNLDEARKNNKPKNSGKYLPKLELENAAKAKLSKDKEAAAAATAAAAAEEYEEDEYNTNKITGPKQQQQQQPSSNTDNSKQSRLNRMKNWKSGARKNSLKLSSLRKRLGNNKTGKKNQANSGNSIVLEPKQEYENLIAESPVILLTYHGGENIEEKFAEEIEKIKKTYELSEENLNFETNKKNNDIDFVPINNDELNIIKHNQNYVLELINDNLTFPKSSNPIEINLDEKLKYSKNLIDYIFNEQGLGKIHFNENLEYCQNFPILIINGEPVVNGIKPMVDSFNNGSLLKLIKVKAEGIKIQSKK